MRPAILTADGSYRTIVKFAQNLKRKTAMAMHTPMFAGRDRPPDWYVVDADGKTLGRLASRIAGVLIGKHKATYTPNADSGDYVVVINAEKVNLTGRKWSQKLYIRHSQFPGGLRRQKAADVKRSHPTRLIELAVRGMLPLNRLRARRMKRLRVFAGAVHGHEAQTPKPLKDV